MFSLWQDILEDGWAHGFSGVQQRMATKRVALLFCMIPISAALVQAAFLFPSGRQTEADASTEDRTVIWMKTISVHCAGDHMPLFRSVLMQP